MCMLIFRIRRNKRTGRDFYKKFITLTCNVRNDKLHLKNSLFMVLLNMTHNKI